MATGIRVRHSRSCSSRESGRCNCKPTYQAQAYDTRTGRQVWRTFPTLSAAKLWRQDAQVALRRGTMRPPTAKTIAEAAEVLINGVRHPLAGAVTMDQLVIDCGDDEVKVGDDVVLLGSQGTDEISCEELALRAGTITHEIICGIGARVPRVLVD